MRYARIKTSTPATTVLAYLPGNYEIVGGDNEYIYIAGKDNAGWTLDGYVIPRLLSGLIGCEEATEADIATVAIKSLVES